MANNKPAKEVDKIKCSDCSLGKLCYPEGLDHEALNLLDQLKVVHRDVEKGEYLVRKGEPLSALYTVKLGAFKAINHLGISGEHLTGFYLSGELMGLEAVATGLYPNSIVALEKSIVCEVGFQHIFNLSTTVPRLQRRLFEIMSHGLSPEFSIPANSSAKARVACLLMNISTRCKRRGLSPTALHLPMSREEIGAYLGLATETVSRVLHSFQEDEMIKLDRRAVTVLDCRRLQVLSCERMN